VEKWEEERGRSKVMVMVNLAVEEERKRLSGSEDGWRRWW